MPTLYFKWSIKLANLFRNSIFTSIFGFYLILFLLNEIMNIPDKQDISVKNNLRVNLFTSCF